MYSSSVFNLTERARRQNSFEDQPENDNFVTERSSGRSPLGSLLQSFCDFMAGCEFLREFQTAQSVNSSFSEPFRIYQFTWHFWAVRSAVPDARNSELPKNGPKTAENVSWTDLLLGWMKLFGTSLGLAFFYHMPYSFSLQIRFSSRSPSNFPHSWWELKQIWYFWSFSNIGNQQLHIYIILCVRHKDIPSFSTIEFLNWAFRK